MARTWVRWTVAATAGLALMAGTGPWVRAQSDRSRAERARCQSNLKQLSVAMMMYTQDYDEVFPPAGKWTTVLHPYSKNTQILQCPADGNPHSYAMNSNLSQASFRKVAAPADVTLFFESNQHKPGASGTATAVAPARHDGGNNYSFVDGHVKWLKTPPAFGRPLPKVVPARPARRPTRR